MLALSCWVEHKQSLHSPRQSLIRLHTGAPSPAGGRLPPIDFAAKRFASAPGPVAAPAGHRLVVPTAAPVSNRIIDGWSDDGNWGKFAAYISFTSGSFCTGSLVGSVSRRQRHRLAMPGSCRPAGLLVGPNCLRQNHRLATRPALCAATKAPVLCACIAGIACPEQTPACLFPPSNRQAHILTAAHCVVDSGRVLDPSEVAFVWLQGQLYSVGTVMVDSGELAGSWVVPNHHGRLACLACQPSMGASSGA